MNKYDTLLLTNYNKATKTYLHEIYKKVSKPKQEAYDIIVGLMLKDKGYDLRIPGYNNQMFSLAYKRIKNKKEQLLYFTTHNVYIINLEG